MALVCRSGRIDALADCTCVRSRLQGMAAPKSDRSLDMKLPIEYVLMGSGCPDLFILESRQKGGSSPHRGVIPAHRPVVKHLANENGWFLENSGKCPKKRRLKHDCPYVFTSHVCTGF